MQGGGQIRLTRRGSCFFGIFPAQSGDFDVGTHQTGGDSGYGSQFVHSLFETHVEPSLVQWLALVSLGVGPTGAAFLLWDNGTKRGDIALLGSLSYLAPLLSTLLLLWTTGRPLSWNVALATLLILGAAVVGTRAR